jgi:peroxiredoxin
MNGKEIAMYSSAPDFELTDSEGRQISLSSYKGVRNVVLIFNRGFI